MSDDTLYVRVAFCFTCRERQEYEKILASANVYRCRGCGATREIDELGSPELKRTTPAPPMREQETTSPPRAPSRTRRTTPMKKTPLMEAIENVVNEALGDLRERVQKLEEAAENVDVADAVEAAITAQLGGGHSKKAASKSKAKATRADGHTHRGPCGAKCFAGAA